MGIITCDHALKVVQAGAELITLLHDKRMSGQWTRNSKY